MVELLSQLQWAQLHLLGRVRIRGRARARARGRVRGRARVRVRARVRARVRVRVRGWCAVAPARTWARGGC